jgi:hypothetical protein
MALGTAASGVVALIAMASIASASAAVAIERRRLPASQP